MVFFSTTFSLFLRWKVFATAHYSPTVRCTISVSASMWSSGRQDAAGRDNQLLSSCHSLKVEPPLRAGGWASSTCCLCVKKTRAAFYRCHKKRKKFFISFFPPYSRGRLNIVPWSVSMCLMLIYGLNNTRKSVGVGSGRGASRCGGAVCGGICLFSPCFWRGEPWSNWKRRCSRCPLGTGSETCCSETGRRMIGKNAAACSIYARRAASVAHLWSPWTSCYVQVEKYPFALEIWFTMSRLHHSDVYIFLGVFIFTLHLRCNGCCNRLLFSLCAQKRALLIGNANYRA